MKLQTDAHGIFAVKRFQVYVYYLTHIIIGNNVDKNDSTVFDFKE